MKRQRHQAVIEELPHVLGYPVWIATCLETGERGFGACEEFNGPGENVIDRALAYLDDECTDAEHIL